MPAMPLSGPQPEVRGDWKVIASDVRDGTRFRVVAWGVGPEDTASALFAF